MSKKNPKAASSKKSAGTGVKDLKDLKPGDVFAYKNAGFGCVSYECGKDVIAQKKGRLFTGSFSDIGMEWTGETWKFDGGMGLVTTIVLLEDVPEGEL